LKVAYTITLLLLAISVKGSDSCLWRFLQKHPILFEWGYNIETYSKSDIRIFDGKDNDFILYDVEARDQPDMHFVLKSPFQITVPQYSVRLGLMLNIKKKRGLVLSFDHAKYVVKNYQAVKVKGKLKGESVDSTMILDPNSFFHFEHTNSANFLQLGYFREYGVLGKPERPRMIITTQLLAGVVIPKTYVKLWGTELDNKFHLAGFILSAELGAKLHFSRSFYLAAQFRAGYANYMDVLAACDAKASHSFFYSEGIICLGYLLSI